MPIYPNTVSSRDPFSTVLHGKDSVFQGPFFYGMVRVSCITYTARILDGLCILYGSYSASNDLLSFPHINNSRPRYGESSKGPMTPPTPPTTIQEGHDATHDESAYPLLILCLDALKMSPELLWMRHPNISRHHPYLLVPASCWNSHQEGPIWT